MVDAATFFPIASGIEREGHYMADMVYHRAHRVAGGLPPAPAHVTIATALETGIKEFASLGAVRPVGLACLHSQMPLAP